MTLEKFVDAHFTFREHPVEFNELLRSFIQRSSG
jgi:pimeloyl-ACP methyl ester carboxylesterase